MTKMDECLFYHHMDLPGFGDVGKGWDLREMSVRQGLSYI